MKRRDALRSSITSPDSEPGQLPFAEILKAVGVEAFSRKLHSSSAGNFVVVALRVLNNRVAHEELVFRYIAGGCLRAGRRHWLRGHYYLHKFGGF